MPFRYQALVEQLPAIVYIDLPQESRTAYVSPQIEQILGVTPGEWLANGELWEQMLHPDDRDRAIAEYGAFINDRGPDLTDYRMVRPDGRVVWLRDRAGTVRDVRGQVVLEQGVMVDVTELKEAQASAQRHAELLERTEAIGRAMTGLVLQGAGVNQVLRTLAGAVANPVVLEDSTCQVIGYATCSASVATVLEAWARHSRVGHDGDPMAGVTRQDTARPRCAWIALWIRGELWGRLHVLEVDSPLDDSVRLPLDRASAAVSVSLLVQGGTSQLADQAQGALLSDIADGSAAETGDILRRASCLGAELAGRQLAAMAVAIAGGEELRVSGHAAEPDAVARECRQTLADAGCTVLPGRYGEYVLALIGLPAARVPAAPLLSEAGARILRLRGVLAVGLSGPDDRPLSRRLLHEAIEAAASGTGEAAVRHYRDLGVDHLLIQLAQGPELGRFVEAELGPLLRHDATARTPLLPTLSAYLEHNGKIASVARAQRLERRTLYYRLARIEKVLGVRLADPQVRLRFAVAVRALALLRRRSVARVLP